MNTDYIFLCGVMWCQFGEQDAGKELLRAAESMDPNTSALAWAMYDFGNSAFATTVMAGFFPLFFKKYWSAGADATHEPIWRAAAPQMPVPPDTVSWPATYRMTSLGAAQLPSLPVRYTAMCLG